MSGIPSHWGFIQDLRQCLGKTVEKVELTHLGYGYTVDSAWTIRFTDGSRAFVTNRPTKGTFITPSEKAMEQSEIFKPEELGDLVAERLRKTQEHRRADERRDREQYEKLRKKFAQTDV